MLFCSPRGWGCGSGRFDAQFHSGVRMTTKTFLHHLQSLSSSGARSIALDVCPGAGVGYLPRPCRAGGRHREEPLEMASSDDSDLKEIRRILRPVVYTKRKIIRPIKKIVAYYRVSEQEAAGNDGETMLPVYSLEDQRRDVARFAAEHDATIIHQFSEVASGAKEMKERPKLHKAIGTALACWATLVVGRQDRLACAVYTICGLLARIDFVSADRPDRTEHEIQYQAVFDQEAARIAAQRTSDQINQELHHVKH